MGYAVIGESYVNNGRGSALELPRQMVPLKRCWGGAGDAVLGAVVDYADGWMPIGGSGLSDAIPRLRRLAEAAHRDPSTIAVIPFGVMGTEKKLAHFASLGVPEVVLRIRSGTTDDVLSELDALIHLVPLAASLHDH